MKKLDITKIDIQKDVTSVDWHRYNDDNADNNSSSTWKISTGDALKSILEYARAHADADIEINLNLE
jgi:hypothetical protein